MRESEDNFDWHLWDGSLRSGMAVHGPDPRYLFLAFARLYLKLSLTINGLTCFLISRPPMLLQPAPEVRKPIQPELNMSATSCS